MMGGDFAPVEAIKGVQLYLETAASPEVHLVLLGDENILRPALSELGLDASLYTIVHAPEVIGMHEHPTKALKEKRESSINIGFHLLQNKKIDAFISAGNTGAMLVGTMYSIKPIEGVLRPTIATVIPKENGQNNLILDVGLNADCKPENLVQFAQLGSIYSKCMHGVDNPRIGLINIGEEEGKGNVLTQATFPLLKKQSDINFVGNVEGRDIFLDKADVLVCEGFVGNTILKLSESVYHIFKEKRGVHDDFMETFNFEIYGGTPVLGVNEPVIIGHGISRKLAFKNMIVVAQRMIETKLMEKIKEGFIAQQSTPVE